MNSDESTMTTISAQSNELFDELKQLGWLSEDKTLDDWNSIWKNRPTFIAPTNTKKIKKPKKNKEPADRCIARVWGNKDDPNVGTGLCQCTKSRKDGSEYCTQHAAQAAICVPIDGYACENPWGLEHGRIDEYIPVADKQGRIIKKWNKGEIAKQIQENLQTGKYKNDGFEAAWSKARKSTGIRKQADYTEQKYQEFLEKLADFEPNEKQPRTTKNPTKTKTTKTKTTKPKKKDHEEVKELGLTSDAEDDNVSEAVKELQNESEEHTSTELHDVEVTEEQDDSENTTNNRTKFEEFVKDGTNYYVDDEFLVYDTNNDREAVGVWEDPSGEYTKESFNFVDVKFNTDESDTEDEDDDEDN